MGLVRGEEKEMKFKEFLMKFDQKHFFLLGICCFSIVLICNILTLIIFWNRTFIFAKISAISMMFFYLFLTLLFGKMYLSLKMVGDLSKPSTEEELDDILKEAG